LDELLQLSEVQLTLQLTWLLEQHGLGEEEDINMLEELLDGELSDGQLDE